MTATICLLRETCGALRKPLASRGNNSVTAVKTSSCTQPWAIAMPCEGAGKKHVDMQKKERQKKRNKPKGEKEENGVARCFPVVSNCGKNV